ncbi:MAG: porin family protein [Chitinophagales bacterium]|nr:porin family protein [Chitinophagales bacterium]
MRQLSLILLISGASLWSNAQNGFHIGSTSTFGGSWILNQNNYETLEGCAVISKSELGYRFKFGYNLGVQMGYNFNNRIGIVWAVTYNQAGQNYEDTFNPGAAFCPDPYHVVRKIDLKYLQVPLYFKYTFGPYGKRIQYYGMLGPQLGIMLKPTETVVINGVEKTDLQSANLKFHDFDFGLALGAGADIYLNQHIYFEIGALTYLGTDINGNYVRNLEWFSKNDVGYQSSHNFRLGLDVGIHYLFNKTAENPFKKKEGVPIPPKSVD